MSVTGKTSEQVTASSDLALVGELGKQLRVDGIRASTRAGSGHPTSSMSASDLIAVLAARHLRYDWSNPKSPDNDHLIFSKGHASPLNYALFKAAGVITDAQLMAYRTFGSPLQGHPTPVLPWIDVATGSLGQGLPIAVGVALAGKYLDRLPYHVWTLCGDSELAEGSVWEALDKASEYRLNNLCAICDINRLGQRGPTEHEWDMDVYRARFESFGCRAIVIDGHDLEQVDRALAEARAERERPVAILARTKKGSGVSEVEDLEGWHGRALPAEMAERAIIELGGIRDLRVATNPPEPGTPAITRGGGKVELPTYELGAKVATRKAYGDTLRALGARPEVVVLDAEVSNSTHAEEFKKDHSERFFEMWIAEQQLVAAAVGMSVRGYVPFASTFAAFFTRAFDFVRMASISEANIRLSGSHAGVEIGADGPSQMALEDLAMMRAVRGSTVLYPSDGNSAAQLVGLMADTDGIVYMRTTRGAYPVIYPPGESFAAGGSKVVVSHDDDTVALIGAGVTLHLALAAAAELEKAGVRARVIDLYSVKPVDTATLREANRVTGGRLVVVEDHHPEGGLGSAVLEALAQEARPPRVVQLAVRGLPGSGTPEELLAAAGIDTAAIVAAARRLAGKD